MRLRAAGSGHMAEVPYPGPKMATGPGHMSEVSYPGPKKAARPGHVAEVPYPGPKMATGPGQMAEVSYPGPKMAARPGHVAEVPYPWPKKRIGKLKCPKSQTLCPIRFLAYFPHAWKIGLKRVLPAPGQKSVIFKAKLKQKIHKKIWRFF